MLRVLRDDVIGLLGQLPENSVINVDEIGMEKEKLGARYTVKKVINTLVNQSEPTVYKLTIECPYKKSLVVLGKLDGKYFFTNGHGCDLPYCKYINSCPYDAFLTNLKKKILLPR
jgi:hypothetical protein